MKLSTIVLITYLAAITAVAIIMGFAFSAMLIDWSTVMLFMVVALCAMTLSSVISYILMKPTYRSLSTMSHQVEAIADGDFNVTVQEKGAKELEQLATSINDMSGKIRTTIADLTASEKEKRELLANLSHDIKTPIASIQSITEALLDRVVHSPEETDHYLNLLKRESVRLNGFVTQIMDIVTLSNDDVIVRKSAVKIDQLLIDVLSPFERTIEAEKRTVHINTHLTRDTINTDDQLVQRILLNLIQNALQFSVERTPLTLTLTETNETISISVCDEGIGIPEEEWKSIFKRTYRVEKSRNKQLGGNGLGLHIAQELAKKLNGIITVKSETGKGSCFTLTLTQRQEELT